MVNNMVGTRKQRSLKVNQKNQETVFENMEKRFKRKV